LLVERETELARLSEIWEGVPKTGGRVALICGEAGIGKSSLVTHFLNEVLVDTNFTKGLCDPMATPRPMGPVLEIQTQLKPTLAHNETVSQRSPTDETYAYFQRITEPTVVFLEDLHWADQGTLDWFKFFGRRISGLPLLLIVSFRDDEVTAVHPLSSAIGQVPTANYHRIQMPPLSIEGIKELGLPEGINPEELYKVTNGNPFFVTEILNARDKSGDVPQSVKDAVNSRINRLPRKLQGFLELASCHPTSIRTEILQELHGDTYTSELAEATRLKFLIAVQGHFRFRHELARRATYARLSASERQLAHKKIMAALLAQSGDSFKIDEILHHADGAQNADKVIEYAPLAAREAAQLGAHREAAKHLAAAIGYIDAAPTEVAAQIYEDWAYEAGLALGIDDGVIEARRLAITLWRALGRSDKVGENLRWLSRLHWYRGEATKAHNYVDEAINVLNDDEISAGKAMSFAVRAQFLMLQDNMEGAISWGEKSLEMARSVNAREVEVHALNTVGTARLFRGDIDGEELMIESLELAKDLALHEEVARVYTNLSEYAVETRQFERAEKLINEGLAFDQKHDLDSWTYYLMGRQAQLRLGQQKFRQCCDIANGILKRDNQTLLMQLPAKIVRSRALLRLGESSAHKAIEDALSDALSVDEIQYTSVVHAISIEKAFKKNDVELATYHFNEIAQNMTNRLSADKWSDVLIWGYFAGVSQALPKGYEFSKGLQLLYEGDYGLAAENFDTDLMNYEAAWCRVLSGNESLTRQADSFFSEIGALGSQKSLRRMVESRGTKVALSAMVRGPNKTTREHAYGLTAKEQMVLVKIAEGASNGDIAKHLSRSIRTIENHVSSILSKLNASNRVEVILRVQGEPWILE